MTLTKVAGDILDPGISVAGIVTATGFDGPFTGGSSKNITAGIITATELDLNGNVDISGNLVVQGDTTTLNTTLRNVELLRVSAASTLPAGIITQTGTGDILSVYDNATEVFKVADGGTSTFTVGTTERFHVDADGTTTHGTLQVDGVEGGDAQIRIRADQGDDNNDLFRLLVEDGGNGLKVQGYDGSFQTRLTFDTDGNVGIGSENPSKLLELSAANPTINVKATANNDASIEFIESTSANFGSNGTNGFRLRYDGGDNRFYIASGANATVNNVVSIDRDTGAFGLGLDVPTARLQVNGTSNGLQARFGGAGTGLGVSCFQKTNNNAGVKFIAQDSTYGTFSFETAGSEALRIKSDGTVGIGTNNPLSLLTLGKSANPTLEFKDYTNNARAYITGSAGGQLVFQTDIDNVNANSDFIFRADSVSNEIVRFKDTGEVGIGITNPEDYQSSSNDFVLGKTNNTGGMTIRSGTGNGGYIRFADGTSGNQAYRGSIAYLHDGDFMQFAVDSEERLRITGAGITVTGEVAASQDYPTIRPTLDFNFAAEKKLDPRITYQRTGPASFVNEFGKVVLVGDNVPRFDHGYEYVNANSVKLSRGESKGLLIEEERTNLVGYSIYNGDKSGTAQTSSGNIGNWSLTLGHATFTGGIDAPDGSNDAVRFTALNTGFALFRIAIPAFTANGSDSYTLSFYARDISGTGNITCDLQDNQPSLGSWNQNMITNEWVRIVVTNVPPSGSKTFIDIMSNSNNNRVFDIWGVQLEKGLFATSFIPTHGSTATRGGDLVKVDGEEFSEFYNPIKSTILIDYTHDITSSQLGTDQRVYRFRAVGGSDTRIDYVSNSGYNPYIAKDGSAVASISHGQSTVFGGGVNRSAVRVKEDSFGVSFNGSAVVEDTSGAWNPTNTITELTLGSSDGGSALNGHIQRFMYYSTGLPNSQLVTLTS